MSEMRRLFSPFLAGVCLFMATAQSAAGERQVTHDSAYDHLLDNNDNFSPDDRFLVFDTRTLAGIHESALIAKVEIATGKITSLYRPEHANAFGPGSGGGQLRPPPQRSHLHPRAAPSDRPGQSIRETLPPGHDRPRRRQRRMAVCRRAERQAPVHGRRALRRHASARILGGRPMGRLHVQRRRGAGPWTRHRQESRPANDRRDQARPSSPRRRGGPILERGAGFSALVVVVTPDPRPGTDEISHAAFDSWVGVTGYQRQDGAGNGPALLSARRATRRANRSTSCSSSIFPRTSPFPVFSDRSREPKRRSPCRRPERASAA